MTREEFAARIKDIDENASGEVTDKEWKDIEMVYNFHPSISETGGKNQIAMLYHTFGFRIIKDMLPTAQMMEIKERELRVARAALQKVQREMAEIKAGGEI